MCDRYSKIRQIFARLGKTENCGKSYTRKMKIMQNDNVDESGFTFFTPVPSEQIPVNEYRSLQESRFFRWAVLERWKYTTKLLAVWIAGFLFSTLIFTTSTAYSLALSDCLWSIITAKIFVLLCLLRLYAAWHYVYSRLLVNKIDYQISTNPQRIAWQKPKLMQERDSLIARFQIKPVLQRLRQTTISIFITLCLTFLFLINNS